MGHSTRLATASAVALALTLAGCGGGGGSAPPGGGTGIVTPTPTPTPTPPPPPPPPPPAASVAAETIGLTQLASFPTLGWVYRFTSDSGGRLVQGPAMPPPSDTVEFGFNAGTRRHEIFIPGLQRTILDVFEVFGDHTGSTLRSADELVLNLLRPIAQNTVIALSHTSFGYWSGRRPAGASERNIGVFAYGNPTTASEMPTGVTRYRAYVLSFVGAEPGATVPFLNGEAQLEFRNDGSIVGLNGEISPLIFFDDDFDDRQRSAAYSLTLRTYVAGGRFTGDLSTPNANGPSMFEGFFTGPGAAELLLRFQAPYRDPVNGRTGTLSGILVAKRI